MQENTILLRRIGRVGVIQLNRPAQWNALNDALMHALGGALIELDADSGIGCIVPATRRGGAIAVRDREILALDC